MRLQRNLGVLATIALVLTSAVLTPVDASSLAQEQSLMSQLQQEASQTYAEISHDKAKAASLHDSLSATETSLGNVKTAIARNQQDTRSVLGNIQALNTAIHSNQVKLANQKLALVGQLRAMYEGGGPLQYVNVLFGSRSFHDFLSRLTLLEIVASKQKQMIHQVKVLEVSIQHQRTAQQSQYEQLMQKRDQLQTFEVAQRILESHDQQLLADVNTNMQSATRRNVVLESQIQLTQDQINQIEAETKKAEELMNNASYVQQQRQSLAQVSSAPIISYAETFMGTPYVWGGTSPSGFDCSGFTQYVFQHFGVSINRTSEDQFAEGVPVSSNNLQPGDLVFFSTYAPGATHVGIYMGNGMMIDAEDRGVTIDNVFNSYWGPKYIGARQILAQG